MNRTWPLLLLAATVVALWLCWPDRQGSQDSGEEVVAPYIVPTLSEKELQQCHDLNDLEEAADHALSTDSPEVVANAVTAWHTALSAWAKSRSGAEPACRTEALGRTVCKDGALLPPILPSDGEHFSFWDDNMDNLRNTLREPSRCQAMAEKYITEHWTPDVFTWSSGQPIRIVDVIFQDPEYSSVYAAAASPARPYGPVQWPLWRYKGHLWNKKRMQNLVHVRALRKAVPDLHIADLEQVVEFGGGTGDLAAAFRDLGFRGTHVVLDMPPMNLLQFYWHRYFGLPSVLGSSLPCNADAARGHVVLESSANDTKLHCHIDRKHLDRSLFFATWSLTEADMATRERIYPQIKDFGTIVLAFYTKFQDIQNELYLERLLGEGLSASHHVLSWKARWGGGFYLIARRRDLGEVTCSSEADCNWATYHYFLNWGLPVWIVAQSPACLIFEGVLVAAAIFFVCSRRKSGSKTAAD